MAKPKKCKLCGPLPGLLFPVNDQPQVQRCDECNIYSSDEEAAQALLAFLKEGNAGQVYLRPPSGLGGWANLGVDNGEVTLHRPIDGTALNWMNYETGWMSSIHHRVKEILNRWKAQSRKARSIISLVTVHHDEASTRADEARRKYSKLVRVVPRVVRAAGLQTTVYVVVETEKEK